MGINLQESRVLVTFVLLITFCSSSLAQNSASGLMIISPPMNTSVTPGQTVQIAVSRAANSGITAVAVHAYSWSDISQGVDPLLFSVTIPPSAQPGPLNVIAADMTLRPTQGIQTISAPLVLNVQSPNVNSLRSTVPALQFKFPGDHAYLNILGVPSGGMPVNLENATNISFESKDTSIAAVDQKGLVKAVSPGQTTIIVTTSNSDGATSSISVPVTVPTLIRGDLNGDHQVDSEDLAIVQGAMNTTAAGPNDARDLNHDGVINALDARILTTLCTFPHCATHP